MSERWLDKAFGKWDLFSCVFSRHVTGYGWGSELVILVHDFRNHTVVGPVHILVCMVFLQTEPDH